MNLMIGSAEPLDIISSVRPDFYYLACLEMAYQVRLGGPGFFRHTFANAEMVKRMHCIGRNNYTCADLSKLPTLLEHRDTITEMLESERAPAPLTAKAVGPFLPQATAPQRSSQNWLIASATTDRPDRPSDRCKS